MANDRINDRTNDKANTGLEHLRHKLHTKHIMICFGSFGDCRIELRRAMTVRISPHKASKILQLFFTGMPQPEIAKKCHINQATVSRYAYRFKEDADNLGITAAAKEYGVMHEVDSLRSLSMELIKNRLTVEEAKEAMAILRLFDSLGVLPAEHKTLIKVISKLKSRDFVPTALKLAELEASTGKSYTEIVSDFENLSQKIKQLEQRYSALKQESEDIRQEIQELTVATKKKQEKLRELEKEIKQNESSLRAQLNKRMKETNVTLKRIERLETIAKTLQKLGISDDKAEGFLEKHLELEELGITLEAFKTMVRAMKT
jgi:DNA repair exonuclease SbcCD ATPase subunit